MAMDGWRVNRLVGNEVCVIHDGSFRDQQAAAARTGRRRRVTVTAGATAVMKMFARGESPYIMMRVYMM